MNRLNFSNPILRSTLATLCLLGALLLPATLAAQAAAADSARDLALAAPEDVGMSSEGLAKLTAAMQAMVDGGELAGIVTMVARHGKIVQYETFGDQDKDVGTAMAKDSIFRIHSMTKPIAGVALMTFYEEGKFELDDLVEDYIPQFKGLRVAAEDGADGNPIVEDAGHQMTIQELVSHTGGLTYGLFSRSQVDTLYTEANVLDRNSTLEQMVDKLGKIPLRQQPGSEWHYSVSVDVQGYLIEILAGKPLDVVLEERIFEPLGMKDTDFWVPPAKAERLAIFYSAGRDGGLNGAPNDDDYLTKPALFSGGGGLASTAMDYMRFSQMLLNGGELDGVRILKPETVELMRTNKLPDSIEYINPMIGNPGNTFGIDFAIVEDPQPPADHLLAKSEYWWYGYGGTWFGINPTQDLIVVGMIQNLGGGAARKARFTSKALAYEAILDPVR